MAPSGEETGYQNNIVAIDIRLYGAALKRDVPGNARCLQWFYLLKYFGVTGTNNNPMVPGLENMVGVALYPIQAVKAFGEGPNLCEVSRCLGETLHLSCRLVLTFSVEVHHSVCPADDSRLPN
ncbi:hypothetical protein TNCV_570691 [Trichonephila clavipes]|nr:hypothetical protein TNCV_570691 [Trichonephila clavipes]